MTYIPDDKYTRWRVNYYRFRITEIPNFSNNIFSVKNVCIYELYTYKYISFTLINLLFVLHLKRNILYKSPNNSFLMVISTENVNYILDNDCFIQQFLKFEIYSTQLNLD